MACTTFVAGGNVCPNRCSGVPTTGFQRRPCRSNRYNRRPDSYKPLQTGRWWPGPGVATVQLGITPVQPGANGGPTGPGRPNFRPNSTQTCPNSDAIRSNPPKLHCQSGPQVVYDRAFVQL